MAGVLAAGDGTVLSHMSAAHAWGFADSLTTEVTRTSSSGRRAPTKSEVYKQARGRAVHGDRGRIPALKIHETRRLDPFEVSVRHGIPTTTVARTFVDIAGLVSPGELRALLHEAGRLGLLKFDELRAVMELSRGKKGLAKLRRIIDDWDPQVVLTRNKLEARMLWLCRRYGVPIPLVNQQVAGSEKDYEVDFLWPDHGLIVETDGEQDHSLPYGIERDRNKDSDLRLGGFIVLRLTWAMLKREPERSMQKVKAHLELCERTAVRQVPAKMAQSAPKSQAPH
ncbi:MAG: DUF559 domain-containing protein [Solirubrobacterales bacterium]